MKNTTLFIALLLAAPVACPLAGAEEHGGMRGPEHHGGPAPAPVRGPAPAPVFERREGGERRYVPAPRPAPAPYQAHPAGPHPHGPIVRAHNVRVLAPKVVAYGGRQWRHWAHPEFARPAYYWDWASIHSVTCIAEDSYGDQYPVTEQTFAGFGLNHMSAVEDDALDRCNVESGGDTSCFLASCSHF